MDGEGSSSQSHRRGDRSGARSSRMKQEAPETDYTDSGAQTSRLNDQHLREMARRQRRRERTADHGAGGEYAAASSHNNNVYLEAAPIFYPNLFPQDPENLADQEFHGYQANYPSYNIQHPHQSHYEPSSPHFGHRRPEPVTSFYQFDTHLAQQQAPVEDPPQQPSSSCRRPVIRGKTGALSPDALIWSHKNHGTKAYLLDLMSRKRGLRHEYARKVFVENLTKRQYEKLAGFDAPAADETINELFPVSEDTVLPVWANLMSPAESDAFVNRMVEITGQRADVVRNYFLRAQLQPGVAKLQAATGDDQMSDFAQGLGLLPPGNERDEQNRRIKYDDVLPEYPWQFNLRGDVRNRVVNLVMKYLDLDDVAAFNLLSRSHVYLGFGLALLQANIAEEDDNFFNLLRFLQSGSWPAE
ncbi:hypothetical protein CBS101457_000250 [Exobasidium rhododendri]|nr:hypothetical protein CBS101457_000250 [Exobasidium rhododendri]